YNNFKVKDLEDGVTYKAYLFNPTDGEEAEIGIVIPSSDRKWQLPELVEGSGIRLPIYQDWILVLEAVK
ncbi:hypothetical protein H5T89_02885, partial [bacterium]|nr:hypothetical protein [bacterium]